MRETTLEDRRRELRVLLSKISAHPEQDLSKERERVAVLKKLVVPATSAH